VKKTEEEKLHNNLRRHQILCVTCFMELSRSSLAILRASCPHSTVPAMSSNIHEQPRFMGLKGL